MAASLKQIESAVEAVWESVVDLPYEDDFDSTGRTDTGTYVLATIVIDTSENYVLSISGSYAAAKHVAGRMFRVEANAVTLRHVCDAFGEVANVLGGNMKTLFAGRGGLSLPEVRKATAAECESKNAFHQLRFRSDGHEFLVELCGEER